MLVSIRRVCAVLAGLSPRRFQNRIEYKCRMREPYFESATPGTPSQDSGCHGCYGTTVALHLCRSRIAGLRMLPSNPFQDIISNKCELYMPPRSQNRRRSLLAVLCLVAVVLLYAPLGGAVWSLYSAPCCTSGTQCPVHGHHHSQTPSGPEHAMDCGHDLPAITECSMSCCHHPERPALTPVVFLLPAPFTVTATMACEELGPLPGSRNTVASLKPLSPPPRILALAA